MFWGPPLPLPDDYPVHQLVGLTVDSAGFGAWLRGVQRELRLCARAAGRCGRVLVSGDLGVLLRCCRRIAVREGTRPVVLEAEVVIQWRTLQVVTATPYLPGLERLRDQFPGLQLNPAGLSVPIRAWSPEAVLAECLAHGIQVTGSRVVYCAS
jgi:hypothetical protein